MKKTLNYLNNFWDQSSQQNLNTFYNQEKILIEMNILNDKDLQTTDTDKVHTSIEEKELENIIKKLDVKKAYEEND